MRSPAGFYTWTPIVFNLYQRLPQLSKYSRARMYADDTTISIAGDTAAQVETLMNADLISIKEMARVQ